MNENGLPPTTLGMATPPKAPFGDDGNAEAGRVLMHQVIPLSEECKYLPLLSDRVEAKQRRKRKKANQ